MRTARRLTNLHAVQNSSSAEDLNYHAAPDTATPERGMSTEQPAFLRAYGSLQGRVALLAGGIKPDHFMLNEISGEGWSVRCYYDQGKHSDVVSRIFPDEDVIHVTGEILYDVQDRQPCEMRVEHIVFAQPLSDEEFQSLFGSMPTITGDMTTDEFIEAVRDRS